MWTESGRGGLWEFPFDDHLQLHLKTGPQPFTSHQPTEISVHGHQTYGGRAMAWMVGLRITIFRRNQSHCLWAAPMRPSSLPGQDTRAPWGRGQDHLFITGSLGPHAEKMPQASLWLTQDNQEKVRPKSQLDGLGWPSLGNSHRWRKKRREKPRVTAPSSWSHKPDGMTQTETGLGVTGCHWRVMPYYLWGMTQEASVLSGLEKP